MRLMLLRLLLLRNMSWFLFLNLRWYFLGRFLKVMFLLLLHRLVMGLIVLCFGYRISILLFRWRTSFSLLVLVMRLFLYIGIFILDYIEISLIFKVWLLIIHILVLVIEHILIGPLRYTFFDNILFVRLWSTGGIRYIFSILLGGCLLG